MVIVSLNRVATLRRSLELLGETHQVIVVDNGSTDGAATLDADFPHVRFMRLPQNFGLTRALNIGLRAAEAETILCLHDDTLISGADVEKLADFLDARPEVGLVAPVLRDASGKPAAQVSPLPTPANPHPAMSPVAGGAETSAEAVSGAAFMFRAIFFRALRQVEERYGSYGSHLEICARMKRTGKQIVVTPAVTAVHEALQSTVPGGKLEGDRVSGTAEFLGLHHGFAAGLFYRLKAALTGLVTFRVGKLTGALGTKIDGN